jgi:hypothetical protein
MLPLSGSAEKMALKAPNVGVTMEVIPLPSILVKDIFPVLSGKEMNTL